MDFFWWREMEVWIFERDFVNMINNNDQYGLIIK